ncbi:MAG TPA: hypothetical protein DEP69_03095, partial [Acidimicrobiaceae bacterium]|nr:hypothetical protein [Acidimicrobiaceae bacterium]
MTDQRFFVVRSPRDVVHISGPEVVDYLQGQISQEVEALETGESRLSFALEPRGRVESLFRLTRLAADIFLADTEPGFGKGLRQSLERFKLGTKAEFETAAWQMLAVRGDCDRALADGLAVDTLWPGSARAAPDAPSAQLTAGFDVLAEAPALSLPAPPADAGRAAEILEWLRLLHGLPLIGREIQPGDIPNETGIVEAAASFTKGCYRGQELVERIDSRAGG